MTDEQVRKITSEVIRRLMKRLGVEGGTVELIAVFSGATVALTEAVRQVRSLLLNGFHIQVVFSPGAEHLLGEVVRRQMEGFPNVSFNPASTWLSSLMDARAVLVPTLSLNTVSKLSLLIADNLAGNILLHALLMGKPVVMARDGADPENQGRESLGFHRGNSALTQAVKDRLNTIQSFGCLLTEVGRLADAVRSVAFAHATERRQEAPPLQVRRTLYVRSRIVTAADVRIAHMEGSDIQIAPSSRITPLARDMARQLGISLLTAE